MECQKKVVEFYTTLCNPDLAVTLKRSIQELSQCAGVLN